MSVQRLLGIAQAGYPEAYLWCPPAGGYWFEPEALRLSIFPPYVHGRMEDLALNVELHAAGSRVPLVGLIVNQLCLIGRPVLRFASAARKPHLYRYRGIWLIAHHRGMLPITGAFSPTAAWRCYQTFLRVKRTSAGQILDGAHPTVF